MTRKERRDRPLVVTAFLSSPLAGDLPKLDAVVEWAVSSKAKSIAACSGGRHAYTPRPRGTGAEEPGRLPSPFTRRNVPGFQWRIPACSIGIVSPTSDLHEHFHRSLSASLDTELIADRKQIDLGGGKYRSYRLPLRVRVCDRIVWFCHADPRHLRRWLRMIHRLGKKGSMGYGTVSRWEVRETDTDYSWFAASDRGTVLMRPLPVGDYLPADLIGARRSYGGCAPPYWQTEFWTEIVEPC